MSRWEEMQFEEKIRTILKKTKYIVRPDHHMAPPFLTAYQIAIEFAYRFPDDFRGTGLPIGGQGVGEHNSLAQYIARELSRRIESQEIRDIQGGFLSNNHLMGISFDNYGTRIDSSLTDSQFDLSMFRLKRDSLT